MNLTTKARHFVGASLLISLGTTACASAQATLWNLGVLASGSGSNAAAISRDGSTVVGQSASRAFRWTREGGMQDLGVLAQGQGAASLAWATSANGMVVVGDCALPSTSYPSWRGFRWSGSQGMTNLSDSQSARAISGDGNSYFGSATIAGSSYAARWESAGSLTIMSSFAGSSVTACSSSGNFAAGQENGRAVRWSGGGSPAVLLTPAATQSRALGMSDDGTSITGDAVIGGVTQAFRWTERMGAVSLGLLAGGDYSQGYAISANGSVIVGQAATAAGSRAFIWTESLGMSELGSYLARQGIDLSGWTLSLASGISADGSSIAGTGRYLGAERAFLVTGLSVPAPAAAPILALAGLLTSSRRRA